jgi:hypothetical protein
MVTRHATATIKHEQITVRIDINISDCSGLSEIFIKIHRSIENCLKNGAKLDAIYFYEEEITI